MLSARISSEFGIFLRLAAALPAARVSTAFPICQALGFPNTLLWVCAGRARNCHFIEGFTTGGPMAGKA
jgi:hypothetical protein